MTRTKANYVDDPDRDFDLQYECHVLLLSQKYSCWDLREFIHEELDGATPATPEKPNHFTHDQLGELIGALDPGREVPGEPTGARRVVESLTEMPQRESLTPHEAKTLNARELGYVLAALRGTKEEMLRERE